MNVIELTNTRRRKLQAGFTLIELTAALALAAIVFQFLPAVQRLREAANRKTAEQTLRAIGSDLEARFRKSGQFPVSLDEILHGSGGGTGVTERKAGGYEFVAVELKRGLVRLAAQPIAGVTGSETGYLEVGISLGGVYQAINFTRTAGADENRARMFAEAHEAVARAFGRFVGLATAADAASALKSIKADSENPARASMEFNSMKGADGTVHFGSIESYLMSSPLSSDSSVKAVFQQLAQDFHRTFRLGALGENIGQLPGASVPPAPEVNSRFFNYARLAQLNARMVVDPNVRLIIDPNFRFVVDPNFRTIIDPNVLTGLLGSLGQAQAADSSGDTATRQKVMDTYINELSSSNVRQFQWGMKSSIGPNPFVPFEDVEALKAVATAMR